MVEGASSKAIFARWRSSSSPSSIFSGCSGGAAEDKLQSQQRWPQLGQYQLSSGLTGLQDLGVGGLSVRDLGVGERSAESACLLRSVSGGEEEDLWRFFPDIGGGVWY